MNEITFESTSRLVKAGDITLHLNEVGDGPHASFEGLGEVPECARSECLHRALGGSEAGDQDAGNVRVDLSRATDQLGSLHVGHTEIRDDDVGFSLTQNAECALGIGCR